MTNFSFFKFNRCRVFDDDFFFTYSELVKPGTSQIVQYLIHSIFDENICAKATHIFFNKNINV